MAKVAKLVLVSLMTRVIVEDTATDEEILAIARPKFHAIVENELMENLESIADDTECPYGSNGEFDRIKAWQYLKKSYPFFD